MYGGDLVELVTDRLRPKIGFGRTILRLDGTKPELHFCATLQCFRDVDELGLQ